MPTHTACCTPPQIVGQFRAKLFRFKKDENAWGDMGVGMLRLMKHTTNDSRRLVLRNDMGKVKLELVTQGLIESLLTSCRKMFTCPSCSSSNRIETQRPTKTFYLRPGDSECGRVRRNVSDQDKECDQVCGQRGG